MEKHFYGGIKAALQVPEAQRFWLLPSAAERVREAIDTAPIDITVGGWGSLQAARDPRFIQIAMKFYF